MLGTRTLLRHLSVAVIALLAATGGRRADTDNRARRRSRSSCAARVSEPERVVRHAHRKLADLVLHGSLGAPFDLVTTKFEIAYGTDWQPQQLVRRGVLGGQALSLTTTFDLTTATNNPSRGQNGLEHAQMSARSSCCPTIFFAPTRHSPPGWLTPRRGTSCPVYLAPEGEVAATVDRIRRDGWSSLKAVRFESSSHARDAAGGRSDRVWVDARQRLARVSLPASAGGRHSRSISRRS